MYRSKSFEPVNSRWLLCAILVVAFLVRLGLAIGVQWIVDRPPARLCLIAGDAEGYWELAQRIVEGKDFCLHDPPRYIQRVPGFSLLLAIPQLLFGVNPLVARCFLVCLGTATCGLTYCLGRELIDPFAGLLAAAYAALSPTQALFSVLFLSETAFAATLLMSLIALARVIRPPSSQSNVVGGGIVVGLLIGIATLVRPTWLYVGPVIAIGVIFAVSQPARTMSQRVQIVSGMLVGIVISMAPWTYRNYVVCGHLVPTSLWVGPSLYDGLHPGATGDSDMQFFEQDNLLARMSEYEMDREYRRRAWDFLLQNPGRAAWLAWQKQQRYWSLVPNAAQFGNPLLKIIVSLSVLPLFVLSLVGAWVEKRSLVLLIVTLGPVLMFAGLHLFFVGSLRYRLPAEFPLAVLAAAGASSLIRSRGWISA